MIDVLPLLDDRKTEEPTERRLRQARDEGHQVDPSAVACPLAFLAALLALRWSLPTVVARLGAWARSGLEAATTGSVPDLTVPLTLLLTAMVPAAVAAVATHLLVAKALGNRLWAPSRLTVDPTRVLRADSLFTNCSPVNATVNILWAAGKLAAMGGLAWWLCPRPPVLAGLEPRQACSLALDFVLRMGASWAFLGAVETGIALRSYHASLRMTRREAEDDFKLSEGSPHVRARIDELARRAAKRGARASQGTHPPGHPAATS